MIVDDYESIATAHARIFAPPPPVSQPNEQPTVVTSQYSLGEMTEDEICDLLAALCELIN